MPASHIVTFEYAEETYKAVVTYRGLSNLPMKFGSFSISEATVYTEMGDTIVSGFVGMNGGAKIKNIVLFFQSYKEAFAWYHKRVASGFTCEDYAGMVEVRVKRIHYFPRVKRARAA